MQAHVLPMHQLVASVATNILRGVFFFTLFFQVKGKNYFRGEQKVHLDRIP